MSRSTWRGMSREASPREHAAPASVDKTARNRQRSVLGGSAFDLGERSPAKTKSSADATLVASAVGAPLGK